jgi:hypothetical protein
MRAVEFAADEQAKEVRQRWLPVLEAYAEKHWAALDREERGHLDQEIQRLRHCLNLPPQQPSPVAR